MPKLPHSSAENGSYCQSNECIDIGKLLEYIIMYTSSRPERKKDYFLLLLSISLIIILLYGSFICINALQSIM